MPRLFFATALAFVFAGLSLSSLAQTLTAESATPETLLIPRPERADYPDRPRLAMIAVAPIQPWADMPGVDQLDAWFEVAQLSAELDKRFDRVERTQLDRAATELTWSVVADETYGGARSARSAMTIGRWVGCDLLLIAEVHGDQPASVDEREELLNARESAAPRLHLTVIDPTSATRLAVADEPLTFPKAKPTTSDIDRLASAMRAVIETADAKRRAAANKPVVMLLHFRNLSRNDRMDRLNIEVPAKLQGLAEAAQDFRMVQVAEPQSSLSEQEMLLTGLLESDPDSWATAADVYLWGSVRELSADNDSGGRGVEAGPAAGDPQTVPLALSLTLWNGRDDPQVFEQRASADQIDTAIGVLVQDISAALHEPLTKDISLLARGKAAYLLAGDVMAQRSVPSFRYDDPADGWRAERFFYWLNAARAARFLDARNPVLSRAAVVVGHPEWASDPWAGFAAYKVDLDQAIRQARSPVIRSRGFDAYEEPWRVSEMRPDEAFYDLVERRMVALLVETFAVLGERTGDRVEHVGGALEYTPPRLPVLPPLSEAERTARMVTLIGESEALGRGYARWKADIRMEAKPSAEDEFASLWEMERRQFEERQSYFEESMLISLTRLFEAHRGHDRVAFTAAIDRWLPVIRSGVAMENTDRLRGGSALSPSEDWPELYKIAIQSSHKDLLAVLQTPPVSTADADPSPNTQTVDQPKPPVSTPPNTTKSASDGWSGVKISRVEGEADGSAPLAIVGHSMRRNSSRIRLKLETSDEDGGRTSYRWDYRVPREKRASSSASRNRPVVSLEDLPKVINAQDARRWLDLQQNEGKLQGGVLERRVATPPPPGVGNGPGMRRGFDGGGISMPPRFRDMHSYAWVDDLPSLPADMPPELAALIKAKRDAPMPAKSRREVLAENQHRRAMGWPVLDETGDLPDHAPGPVVEVDYLRVRVAGHSLPWPVFRPEPSRPAFGPMRWVHGWLAASTYPAASDNPRGPRFERGGDAHRDLRWLHPVSLADRYPGLELPEDTLVTDIAEASTDGSFWVATHGRGLLRIEVDRDRQDTRQQSFTTRNGLIDQRLHRLLMVGDHLLAFGQGGVSILSDLDAKRPAIRDAKPKQLSANGPAFAVGRYAYFATALGGWWDPESGEVVLLDDWLQENLTGPYDVIGGFVQGDRSWVILADRLICIESNLGAHRSFPLPVPGHRSLIGVADEDVVWLAYPDPLKSETSPARVHSNEWRHFDPAAHRDDSNQPPPRRSSRLVAIQSDTGELLGQTSIEGQVQQLTLGGGELFVAAPSGLWDVAVIDRDRLLTAMTQVVDAKHTSSDASEVVAQRLAFVPETAPLIRAAVAGDVERVAALLDDDDADAVDAQDPATGLTALLAAARYGHFEVAKQLLEAGADSQIKSEVTPWIRPLMMSAMNNDADLFLLLIEHGALRRGHNQRLGTEAHAAVLHESYDVLEALPPSSSLDRFARGPRVMLIPAKGHLTLKLNWFTPMLLAVERGDARAVAALVEAGHRVCSPGARDNEEYLSPLCLAASLGRGDLLRLMLADPRTHWHAEHGDRWHASPWDYAVWFNQPDSIRAMLDCGIDPPMDPDLLLVAARAGALPLLESLQNAGLDLNHVWTSSRTTEMRGRPDVGKRAVHMTALTTAVSHGHYSLIDPMASRLGIDLDADLAGDTQRDLLLRLMLERGDLVAAIDLVAGGADVDGASQAYYPATLLSLVAERGEVEAVEFLLRLGADPKAKGRDGRNALQVADNPQVKAMLDSASR